MTRQTKPRRAAAKRKSAKSNGKSKPTKTSTLLKLLHRPNGASLEELMKASSWQAHSVRGFLSGTVRKKLKLVLLTEVDDKSVRRYRIAEASEAV